MTRRIDRRRCVCIVCLRVCVYVSLVSPLPLSSFEAVEDEAAHTLALRECGARGSCLYSCVAVHAFGVLATRPTATAIASGSSSSSTALPRASALNLHARFIRHLVADVLEDDSLLSRVYTRIYQDVKQRAVEAGADPDQWKMESLEEFKTKTFNEGGASSWEQYCRQTRCE